MTRSPRFRRAALITLGLVIVIALAAFPQLGPWLVVEDPLDKADAIVVLGGTMYERPLEAVDLYNAGYAPKIFLIREIPDWGERLLLERHIPIVRAVDIQIETAVREIASHFAYDNAEHDEPTLRAASDQVSSLLREKLQERLGIARATSSLPVPLSPWISTATSVAATRPIIL